MRARVCISFLFVLDLSQTRMIEAGTLQLPFASNASISLYGDRNTQIPSIVTSMFNPKRLDVLDGGTLSIHSERPQVRWARLINSSYAGDDFIVCEGREGKYADIYVFRPRRLPL